MIPGLLAIVAILVVAQLALPKQIGFLPLIIAGCHLGNVEVLPQLTPIRILMLLGLIRAVSGGFFVFSPKTSKLDFGMLVFAFFAVLSTVGHKGDEYIPSPLNARVGLVINVLGTYLYGRAYLPDIAAFKRYVLILPLVLIPLSGLMLFEKRTTRNFYFVLGARSDSSMSREEKIRAQGPFQHPILAGTAGSTVLPFAYLIWRWKRRKQAILAFATCMGIVIACASSGPLAAVAVTAFSVVFWRWRRFLKHFLWTIVLLALAYNLIKGRGPWYLMASIDLVGGSTGWHRAKLIDQGVTYLNEWWLFGTDYTRHWMASGVRWNPNMVDLTNYYLHLGVIGGLPLTICLFAFLVMAFRLISTKMLELRARQDPDEMVLWAAGSALAAHAISFVSISYFDQMYAFFYVLVGAIPGLVATAGSVVEPAKETVTREEPTARLIPRYYS